jgi:integrase
VNEVTTAPGSSLIAGGGAEEALHWLRDVLGTVAPRDPRTRRLGERRHRLDLLAELCERDTFLLVASWLGSDSIPSPNSKQGYADDIRMWSGVAKELGKHDRFFLGCITSEMIETWTKIQKARGAAPRTVNRRLSALTSFTQYAAWKLKRNTIVSPVSKYDRAPVDRHDETTATPVLSKKEFQAIMAAASTPQEALVPALLYTLAGRVSECCAAQIEDMKQSEDGYTLNLRRKGGKGRSPILPDDLRSLILVATEGRTSGPILTGPNGEGMDRHAVDAVMTRLGKKAGVLSGREATPHVARASRLTHMHDEGVPIGEIQEYADHEDISTTLRYIRMRDESLRKARHARAASAVYSHLTNRFLADSDAQQ